jgi:GNAT superfamily N-acetyltransferase
MTFRRFAPEDAEFCFKVRSAAFIIEFYGELSPQEVAACVNCYMPSDYMRMATTQQVFVCEQDGQRIGFFTLKRHDRQRAEMPLLYLDLRHLRKGTGSAALRYAEEWIRVNWREVTTFLVDTVIPKYNGGFYQKAGFLQTEEVGCEFGGLKVKALRFTKRIDGNSHLISQR